MKKINVLLITILMFSTMMISVFADNEDYIEFFLDNGESIKIEFEEIIPVIEELKDMKPGRIIDMTDNNFGDPRMVHVFVNDSFVDFPDQYPYINDDGRTLVPVRFVAQELGAKVEWNGLDRAVTITKDDTTISLKIGESKALINDKEIVFDTKAVIENNRTMVPVRFISEAFGATVRWVENERSVKIETLN